jgi:hypothetical protein
MADGKGEFWDPHLKYSGSEGYQEISSSIVYKGDEQLKKS